MQPAGSATSSTLSFIKSMLFEERLRFGREASFLDKRVLKENARARISSHFPRDQKDFTQGRTFFPSAVQTQFFFPSAVPTAVDVRSVLHPHFLRRAAISFR